MSVIVEVGPASAHPSANVFNLRRVGDRGERPVTVVAIQVIAPKIVRDIEIGQAIGSGLAPRTSETVPIVINVQPSRFGPLYKARIAFVVQQAIGWPVTGVEIGNWIMILIEAKVVAIQAEVNIETSIAIVVSNSCMREGSL